MLTIHSILRKIAAYFSNATSSELMSDLSTIENNDYFQAARSWSDDCFAAAVVSRNRWRAIVIYILLPMLLILFLYVLLLIPAQHLQPLLVTHYEDGTVSVMPVQAKYNPINHSQVMSDIVRYVYFREAYSPDSYAYSYRLIHVLSNQVVAKNYANLQSSLNSSSPIHRLGRHYYQTIKIQNIVFLDKLLKDKSKRQHHNLAEVNFVKITHNRHSDRVTRQPMTVILGWQYQAVSKDPEKIWLDWDGFKVTSYELVPRHP